MILEKRSKQLPLTVALGWIVGSALITTAVGYHGLKAYKNYKRREMASPTHRILSIIQTGPQKEALKTEYLAQLMGISADRPVSSLIFDIEKAEKALLASPLIKEARVKVNAPNVLYVDYTVRQPIAWLYDFTNTALDHEGIAFPAAPFLSPKNLPEIYLGMDTFDWHVPIPGKGIALALDLIQLLTEPKYRDLFHVKRVDVSKAYADSYGEREIVLMTQDHIQGVLATRLLRFSTKNHRKELGNYLKLREKLIEEERQKVAAGARELPEQVIDFRIPHLAYIGSE